MALDINKIKSRYTSLKNNNNKKNLLWKPTGTHTIRILPYKHNPDEYSFIELKFHYGINNKSYLSPDTFNRPDPIVEWANKLQKTGVKEEWILGKKMEPKLRTYVPIIVRGEENLGVRFWGFGKQVYNSILAEVSDPETGDITDLQTGRDIIVEFTNAAQTGKSFPDTKIRVKKSQTKALSDDQSHLLENQPNILDLFPEYSYDELKKIMEDWLANTPPQDGTTPTGEVDVETKTVEDKLDELFKK